MFQNFFHDSFTLTRRTLGRVLVTLFALAAFGVSCGEENEAERFASDLAGLDGYVVEFSFDCRSVTCSGSGTDWFDPAEVAGVDCSWPCGLYEGQFLEVRARFLFGDDGCFVAPQISTKLCD